MNPHRTFVEPFCGGASVSIALLEANVVEQVVLNDLDPLVSALWKCVFSKDDAAWLADAVMAVPLTLEFWKYQKKLEPLDTRGKALKCLYLNRTSFSGVLHSSAGPIGGLTQSKWHVGCRFNKDKLRARIIELSKHSKKVKVHNSDYKVICRRWSCRDQVLIYLDPPFYHKATRLYRYVFDIKAHYSLRQYLQNLNAGWILSYDNSPEIRLLYADFENNGRLIDNTYSAHPIGGNSHIGKEVIFSNLSLPNVQQSYEGHVGLTVRALEPVDESCHLSSSPTNAVLS